MDCRHRLTTGMALLGLSIDQRAERLLDYLQLIERWNRVYNLTAIRDPVAMVDRHLLDCLAILAHLPPGAIADLGAGAGLPGLIIAIWEPQRSVTLIESNGKKARFMRLVARELRLDRVEVLQQRAEAVQLQQPLPLITARACATLADLIRLGGHLLADNGHLLAMKGRYPDQELAQLPAGWRLAASHRLSVPDVDEERHLLDVARDVADGSV